MARSVGDKSVLSQGLQGLAPLYWLEGDLTTAASVAEEALAYARETGASQWLLLVLLGFGVVACFGGEAERGLRLFAAGATPLRQRRLDLSKIAGGHSFRIMEQTLEKAREQLGPAAFATAWAEGQQLTTEQALALVMEDDIVDMPLPETIRVPGSD